MIEIKNAKIISTQLGQGDRGWTFYINVGGERWGQGIGGFSLGGEYTDYVLKGIIKAVGVDNWEDLVGKNVRIKKQDGMIIEIGHILEEKWFNPKGWRE